MNATEIKRELQLDRSSSIERISRLLNEKARQKSERQMACLDPNEFLRMVTGNDLVVSNEVPVKELMSLMNDSPNRGEELVALVPQVTPVPSRKFPLAKAKPSL
jgi:hypothetical protein